MMCPKCGSYGTTVGHTFYCYECGNTAKVQTNFERVAESPEKLAEFIAEQFKSLYLSEVCVRCKFNMGKGNCKVFAMDSEYWRSWLQKEEELE